jgi:hypothetical protein
MNRRGFLKGLLGTAAAVATVPLAIKTIVSTLPKSRPKFVPGKYDYEVDGIWYFDLEAAIADLPPINQIRRLEVYKGPKEDSGAKFLIESFGRDGWFAGRGR